jgi:hypothetical protein
MLATRDKLIAKSICDHTLCVFSEAWTAVRLRLSSASTISTLCSMNARLLWRLQLGIVRKVHMLAIAYALQRSLWRRRETGICTNGNQKCEPGGVLH